MIGQAPDLRRALEAQCLIEPAATAEEAVDRSAGLSGAAPSCLLSLAVRVRGFTPQALARSLEARTVLRVPAMRGSLYLMPAARAADGLALARPGTVLNVLRQAGIERRRYEAIADAAVRALAGRRLTAAAIRREVGAPRLGRLPDGAWTLIVRAMSHEGRIVRAATRGGWSSQMFEYAATEDWLGRALRVPPIEDALRRLAPWYLRAHAPATARDFAWWSGASLPEAEAALRDAAPPDGRANAGASRRSVVLLPHWDAYLMAHVDRSRFLDERWRSAVIDRSGNTTNVIVAGGRVAGVWDYTGDVIRYARFGRAPATAAIERAAAPLEAVLGPRALVEVATHPNLARASQNAFAAPLTRR